MKATGIVRKVDDLGRIVVPIELRRTLGIAIKDPIEIFVEADRIILRRYEPACMFCGGADDTLLFRGKTMCRECVRELATSASHREIAVTRD